MKIVHICLACFFPDGYSYQENILPKFHKKQGFDVEVIASLVTFDGSGKQTLYAGPMQYRNEYDIPVTRLAYRRPNALYQRLRRFTGLRGALERSKPDILFIHGCQFMDIDVIAAYAKRHPNVRIYVDNHADFSNSAKNRLSRAILHGGFWKRCARRIAPYAEKFYGVLPARVDFLKDVYGLPEEQCELLVMGADDELVERAKQTDARRRIRERYHIAEDDFLIVTGGKIDRWKTQTVLLMQAVRDLAPARVKLLVFGSVEDALKQQVDSLSDGDRVQYIGWIRSEESYEYFEAADLAVFPGRHSVLWEQAAGQGVPMLVKDWPGTHHVDLGGNVRFLCRDSVEEIRGEIERLLLRPEEYTAMKQVAERSGKKMFSYREISKRAILN